MRLLPMLVLVAGCGFQVSGVAGDSAPGDDQPGQDGGGSGSDSGGIDAPTTIDIAHVAPGDETSLTSTADWTIAQNQVLDTGSMQANPPLPSDVVMKVVTQENGGPDLMIVQAHRIELASGITFRVVGTRALVLVSSTDIVIGGTLDGSADHQTPGPAGAAPSMGTGGGNDAVSDTQGYDTGGNGGSFGSVGARGGSVPDPDGFNAPADTPAYGDAGLVQLVAGSGGGNAHPTECMTSGGGGGGAIQLTARSVSVNGSVRVNGGGGEGGSLCMVMGFGDASSGGGGGSGGAIFIQADTLSGSGWLVANGGGGGGGGCSSCQAGSNTGESGANGVMGAQSAGGGDSPLSNGAGNGGLGGAQVAATRGTDGGNGGGGGGAVGRIHLLVMPSGIGAINASPAAQ